MLNIKDRVNVVGMGTGTITKVKIDAQNHPVFVVLMDDNTTYDAQTHELELCQSTVV